MHIIMFYTIQATFATGTNKYIGKDNVSINQTYRFRDDILSAKLFTSREELNKWFSQLMKRRISNETNIKKRVKQFNIIKFECPITQKDIY